jgi:2-polyprenyl-3-methyl-5-hydroxy-6-metoxy-1,4-benzoquinol methylase
MDTKIQVNSDLKEAPEETVARGERCAVCGSHEVKFWLEAPDRFNGRTELWRLLRCSQCSLVWLDNPPQPHEMSRHYGPDYDRIISSSGETSPKKWRDRLKTISQHKPAGAILDLGCSSGAFLASLKGPDWKLYGIEMSAETAKRAEANTGGQIFVGDIMDAPFAPQSFDVITCFDVLEHVYEPLKVLTRIQEWLKPGGIFFVLVPNIDSGEARAFKSYWYGLELPRHLSHFSPASLRTMAKSAGMEEVSLVTHPNSALGHSHRYVFDDLLKFVGISRKPMAMAKKPSFPVKAARKLVRLGLFPIEYQLISLLGEGEGITAIFTKGTRDSGTAGK